LWGGRVERMILCSGKVYWDLLEQRAKETRSVVILRVEQFYPWPADLLQRILNKYPRGHANLVWVQEESHNMGGWFFIEPRLRQMDFDIKYIGRDDSASPATGSLEIHKREQRELVLAAFHASGQHLVSAASAGDYFGAASDKPDPAKNGAAAEQRKGEAERAKK
jgi:2-oxoglutarate dehydrogenase E1 component